MERLDKIVSLALNITRSEAKKIIKSGRISVSDKPVVSADEKAEPESVFIDGKRLNYKEHIYIMLNKPQGVISASRDRDVKTVVDLVPEQLKRKNLFPAGRLDADSVGFVLITDDGEFAHNILSPKKHVQKTYEIKTDGEIADALINEFAAGVTLSDGTRCMPAELKIISPRSAQVKIKEGRYHQIKRMFAAFGLKVVFLKRTAIGLLQLDKNLAPGECKEIKAEQLKLVQMSAYGKGEKK